MLREGALLGGPQKALPPLDKILGAAPAQVTSVIYRLVNLRPGGGGSFWLPLWFFEDNSKTKGSSVTKLGIPFH